MKRIAQIFLATLVVCGLSNACNKPSSFGSEILPSEDGLNIEYTEEIGIKASSVVRDSIIVFSENVQFFHNLCGEVNDPVFGKAYSQVFSQLFLGTKTRDSNLVRAVLDSTIMRTTFSETTDAAFKRHFFKGSKSNPKVEFIADIHRMTQPLERSGIYYSDESFDYVSSRIGRVKVDNILDFTKVDRDTSYVEFPLSSSLWNDLVNYSDKVFESDVVLQEELDGILFIPRTTTGTLQIPGMAALDLNGRSFITFHFHNEDANGNPILDDSSNVVKNLQVLTINSKATKVLNFVHDRTGSVSKQFIDNPVLNDSLIFLQGLAGIDSKIEFTNLESLGNVAINNAELELIVKEMPGIIQDDEPALLIASFRNDDGTLSVIQDVIGSQSGGILNSYGGDRYYRNNAITGELEYYYTLNISKHLQRVLDGDFANRELYISIFDKQETAARVVLGGAKNADIGMKLKITYTNL